MTPKDNELRIQVGLAVTHSDDEFLFVRSEKNSNILDALQAFAALVRQDEREKCAELCATMDWQGRSDEAIWKGAAAEECAAAIRARENNNG